MFARGLILYPVLILTCIDPPDAVLNLSLDLFCHSPLAEIVDNQRIEDLVLEILRGDDIVLLCVLNLIRVDVGRVYTWTGVFAIHHQKLLNLP